MVFQCKDPMSYTTLLHHIASPHIPNEGHSNIWRSKARVVHRSEHNELGAKNLQDEDLPDVHKTKRIAIINSRYPDKYLINTRHRIAYRNTVVKHKHCRLNKYELQIGD